MSSNYSQGAAAPRDRKSFTEDEYRHELTLHRIKLEGGQLPSQLYRRFSADIGDEPKSGVFRDYYDYGVHPSRVVLNRINLTIPFLIQALTAQQLAAEITNQKQRTEKKPTPETKWDEEKDAEKRGVILETHGRALSPPSPDAAYDLIKTLQERKNFVDWTTPVQKIMSALNFYFFSQRVPTEINSKFFLPPRERAVPELAVLIPRSVIQSELDNRMKRNPETWGTTGSMSDIPAMLGDLMTQHSLTSDMRQIIEWYRTGYRRDRLFTLIESIIRNQSSMVQTIRLRLPIRT